MRARHAVHLHMQDTTGGSPHLRENEPQAAQRQELREQLDSADSVLGRDAGHL